MAGLAVVTVLRVVGSAARSARSVVPGAVDAHRHAAPAWAARLAVMRVPKVGSLSARSSASGADESAGAARRERRRQVHPDEDRRRDRAARRRRGADRRRAGRRARRPRATALGIAFIHQELNLLDNLDVAGNVLLGREPTGWGVLRLIDRAKMRETVRPYLDQLGLDVSPDTPVAALSIARQQLVEIAKALSLNARLLIMDEPTSSLTIAEAGRLHEVVASLRERGAAVIYITHRLGEVRDGRRPCGRLARRRERRHAGARGTDARQHDLADGRPRNRRRARCGERTRRAASTSESTGCVPGGIPSMPCRSPSGAERLSGWPVWSAPAGRKSRSRYSASTRRSPEP